ncbi:MAG: hypothetical protein FWC47_03670 [Oscillospiraceae bacterium]|nr:hypothetical protein [Oscillospiraceae bacterium]
MGTNYSKHATFWDWDKYDRSKEFEFWYKMSKNYGKNVLCPMYNEHFVSLQLYDKDVLFNLINDCGFKVIDEFSDYDFNKRLDSNCFLEIKKI